MKKYYWLGPGILKAEWKEESPDEESSGKSFKRKIQPDGEIPPEVIRKMTDGKLKKLLESGKIGDEPRSARFLKVAQNAKSKIKALEEGQKQIAEKFDRMFEKKDALISDLKVKLKRKMEEFKKALAVPGALEKENKRLSKLLEKTIKDHEKAFKKAFEDREKAIEEARAAMEEVKAMFKENESFKKALNDWQKKYKALQKERDILQRSLDKAEGK
jgi:DNA repair exonuclease SbcCD ATPase subunit